MPSARTPPPATSAIVTVCSPSLKLFFQAFQIIRRKAVVPTIGAESSPKTFRYSNTAQPDSTMAKMRRTLIEPLHQAPLPYRSEVEPPEKLTAALRA